MALINQIIPFDHIPIIELTTPALLARFNSTLEKSDIIDLISHIITLEESK